MTLSKNHTILEGFSPSDSSHSSLHARSFLSHKSLGFHTVIRRSETALLAVSYRRGVRRARALRHRLETETPLQKHRQPFCLRSRRRLSSTRAGLSLPFTLLPLLFTLGCLVPLKIAVRQ